jgi:hypothetical protein
LLAKLVLKCDSPVIGALGIVVFNSHGVIRFGITSPAGIISQVTPQSFEISVLTFACEWSQD